MPPTGAKRELCNRRGRRPLYAGPVAATRRRCCPHRLSGEGLRRQQRRGQCAVRVRLPRMVLTRWGGQPAGCARRARCLGTMNPRPDDRPSRLGVGVDFAGYPGQTVHAPRAGHGQQGHCRPAPGRLRHEGKVHPQRHGEHRPGNLLAQYPGCVGLGIAVVPPEALAAELDRCLRPRRAAGRQGNRLAKDHRRRVYRGPGGNHRPPWTVARRLRLDGKDRGDRDLAQLGLGNGAARYRRRAIRLGVDGTFAGRQGGCPPHQDRLARRLIPGVDRPLRLTGPRAGRREDANGRGARARAPGQVRHPTPDAGCVHRRRQGDGSGHGRGFNPSG